jgi:hypothetical protein
MRLNQRSVDEGGWAAMVAHSTDRIADALATRLIVSKEIARGKLDAGMKSGAHYLFSKTQVVIRNIASIVVMSVFAAILLYFTAKVGSPTAPRWFRSALTSLLTCSELRTTLLPT